MNIANLQLEGLLVTLAQLLQGASGRRRARPRAGSSAALLATEAAILARPATHGAALGQ